MTLFKPSLQQQFDGQIWKLLIDPARQLLYAEIRDTDSHKVTFCGFDMENGSATFAGFTAEEKWLTGMEGCFDGVLLLHGYQSAQSPVHKGITAVDGLTGDVLWSNYTYAIRHISINGPVAYNTQLQPPRLFLLNVQTGATIRPYEASIDLDLDPGIKMPVILEAADNELKRCINGQVIGNIDYINHNSFRIVSLHALVNTQLSQLLLIMQGDTLVYEDLLIDNIQKLQPEAFIMHGNRLVYVKNKIELKVLNL